MVGALCEGLLLAATLAVLAGFVAVPAIAARGNRGGRALRLVLVAFPIAVFVLLRANAIDVSRIPGRVVHAAIALAIVLFVPIVGFFLTRRGGSRWLAAWFACGALLTAAETIARAVPLRDTQPANPGGAFFWPDWFFYPRNALGHRDRPFAIPKPPARFRILLLGDSYTEGAGLSRTETFGRLLEARLNDDLQRRGAAFRAEVYNLGHCGDNTLDESRRLARDGDRLQPDLVILSYVTNDAETDPPRVTYGNPPGWFTRIHRVFLERLRSYAYYEGYVRFDFRANFANGYEFMAAEHADPAGWSGVRTGLHDIAAWCGRRGIPAIALLWPVFSAESSPLLDDVYRKVNAEMRHNGFTVRDLRPVFSGDLSRFQFSPEDWHPNAEANRIVAAYLDGIVRALPTYRDAGVSSASKR